MVYRGYLKTGRAHRRNVWCLPGEMGIDLQTTSPALKLTPLWFGTRETQKTKCISTVPPHTHIPAQSVASISAHYVQENIKNNTVVLSNFLDRDYLGAICYSPPWIPTQIKAPSSSSQPISSQFVSSVCHCFILSQLMIMNSREPGKLD